MSTDLPRTVIAQWTNARGEEEEVTTGVHGHSDFALSQWAQAFRSQHADLLREIGDAPDLAVFIEIDLD